MRSNYKEIAVIIIRRMFAVLYPVAVGGYRLLKKLFRPFIYAHPRLYRFAVALRAALKELLPTRPATNWPEWLAANWPEWLAAECRALHEIEPQIFPDKDIPLHVITEFVPITPFADYYLHLRSLCGEEVSHVFLVSWLKKGGADLVVTNYVRALIEGGAAKGVVVVATENSDSPWAAKLHPAARFIEFGKLYSHLPPEVHDKLLTRLLMQMSPHAIHVINSLTGYRIFIKHGKTLNSLSKLYATVFCADHTSEGKSVGFAYDYLPDCFDYLAALSTDNRHFAEKLCDIYAFDPAKICVHYQPAGNSIARERRKAEATERTLNILWAGRLDMQKRPDILASIAEKCLGEPFHFHVYGEPVMSSPKYVDALRGLSNVTYHGPYDGLYSLPLERFDIFLYTSQWDGLPNVLLDAMSVEIPVVASDAGGVGELIISGRTGFLIDPYDDVMQYIERLREIRSDPSIALPMLRHAAELIRARHTWMGFIEEIRKFPGYAIPVVA